MRGKSHHFPCFLLLLSLDYQIYHSQAQPSIYGYTCSANTSNYPCQSYVYYLAQAPDYLDLASIGDLFNLSRLSISKPSNISNPAITLLPNQPLLIPISCGCNPVKNQTVKALSFANITYTIKPDDTFHYLSTQQFENLTTVESVEVVNPTLVPEDLQIGSNVYFPIFCKCPTNTQLLNKVNFIVSYVFQDSDSLDSIASKFGVSKQSLVDVNGNNLHPLDTVFVPVAKLPHLNQPPGVLPSVVGPVKKKNKGAVVGLGIGLGICVLLLALIAGLWVYREVLFRRKMKDGDFEGVKGEKSGNGRGYMKEMQENLILADVFDTLDKYRVYEIDELKKATEGFDERCLVQGSVYKGYVDGKLYAIKKMKWNAYEELKILQKVNHGSLVRLEGFCIDPDDASCYLVYEYIENGSLHSWLHKNIGKLHWRTRLRVAIDVANGLQYMHEHTRPQVVHKDIKSSNILLDINMGAKIANFGLAKSGCNAITRHIVGTQGYIAPEYLTDGVVSPKMDVFSFGVILLELISGKEAIDEDGKVLWMNANKLWEGTEEEKARKVMEWVDESLLEDSYLVESMMNIMNVAVACVNPDPSKRPSMIDVVYTLCKGDDLSHEFSSSPLKARAMEFGFMLVLLMLEVLVYALNIATTLMVLY